jgi:hypothetical protein
MTETIRHIFSEGTNLLEFHVFFPIEGSSMWASLGSRPTPWATGASLGPRAHWIILDYFSKYQKHRKLNTGYMRRLAPGHALLRSIIFYTSSLYWCLICYFPIMSSFTRFFTCHILVYHLAVILVFVAAAKAPGVHSGFWWTCWVAHKPRTG